MRQRLFPSLALVLMLAGCAGYHIGPVKPYFMRDVNTVAVPNFKNSTTTPQIENLVTTTVIKQIQQDGTYTIAPADRADVIIEGNILDLRRRSERSVRGNVLATSEFSLEMTLEFDVVRRSTGEHIEKRKVRGYTSFFVGGDLQQDERQAIPLAVENAAQQLVSEISEGW